VKLTALPFLLFLLYNKNDMFDSLSERLQNIFRKKLTAGNMEEQLREIRRALLEADVNLRVVKSFVAAVKEKAEGQQILKGVNPSQQLVKITNDELTEILGGQNAGIDLSGKPNIIMMMGLQGSGKTTTSAKLAVKLKDRRPLLVACDIYRPAAISQLQSLGGQIGAEVFTGTGKVLDIAKQAVDYAKKNGFNTVILDTAGRLQVDNEMMAELKELDKTLKPAEKLLVIDAMTGQEAVNIAETFEGQIGVTGLVLTKLDGDARGGAALSVVHCTGKPIKFTGTGEKTDALEEFYPERMASRILGMGDIVSLVEKAQDVFDEKESAELQKKMQKAEFSFDDFLKVQRQMKAFGSIGNVLGMIPGMKLGKDDREKISHLGETKFKQIEVFIQSMTPAERANPQLIDASRKKRIAAGSGIAISEVNQFISQFEQMRSMMKAMSGANKSGKIDPQQLMAGMKPKAVVSDTTKMKRKFK
jgi:signal recognition particle subunit SRP54